MPQLPDRCHCRFCLALLKHQCAAVMRAVAAHTDAEYAKSAVNAAANKGTFI